MSATLVIADDEKNTREGLKFVFQDRKDIRVLLAADGNEALQHCSQNTVDILLTDLKMPGLDGLSLLAKVRQISPGTAVVLVTGHGTVESAVDALKSGAEDYLIKPINIDELQILVERILARRTIETENRVLSEENRELREKLDLGFENIIGRSESMAAAYSKVRTVAPTRATVLLYGESGTGKELFANAIHQNSTRKNKPYIKVNCGALPLNLLESELFGHEKGAFTGAVKQRAGRFEMADGGTILLDEITETAPEFQVKLLRVLQEGEFERVGGMETIRTDVRLIAASNRRLEDLVAEGKFREDLYYRLKVVEIVLPPLRERREDIPLLVNHFLAEFARYYGKPRPAVQAKAMNAFVEHDWPGNVRQLRNVLEGMFVMAQGDLTVKDLPDNLRGTGKSQQTIRIAATASLKEAEQQLIQAALLANGGNRVQTAKSLGLGRKTLYRKLEQYGIQ